MKAYQLVFIDEDRFETNVSRSNTLYSSREEAEKACAWYRTIPEDPIMPTTSVRIQEVEIVDTFAPWIPEERLAKMRKEIDEYWARVRAEETQSMD